MTLSFTETEIMTKETIQKDIKMAQYFETFPKLLYDIDNTKNFKLVTDIFRRIKVREQLKENAALFSIMTCLSGTTETTSFKHFSTTDYF